MGIPHPEGCSGYGRSRADDTSASPPPGAFPPRPDSSGGEAAVSRPPDGDAHAPFWSSTKSGMPPARRTGPSNVLAFQMVISAFCTAGPTRGGRCRRRRFVAPPTSTSSPRRYRCPAWCRTRVACLLQYPASSQKSSSIADFVASPAFRISRHSNMMGPGDILFHFIIPSSRLQVLERLDNLFYFSHRSVQDIPSDGLNVFFQLGNGGSAANDGRDLRFLSEPVDCQLIHRFPDLVGNFFQFKRCVIICAECLSRQFWVFISDISFGKIFA